MCGGVKLYILAVLVIAVYTDKGILVSFCIITGCFIYRDIQKF